MRILIIEDEAKTARAIRQVLSEEGYAVDLAGDGEEGLFLATENRYDVIILDVRLPKLDGVSLCRRFRKSGGRSPILMLTANTLTYQKVEGLDAGADDYLAKPFDFEELIARVRALCRRRDAIHTAVMRVGPLELDPGGRTARRDGRALDLSPKEFAILEFLMRRAGHVATRTEILEGCWDMNYESDSNPVDVHVASLRRKIDAGKQTRTIETVRGAGYVIRVDR